MNQENLVQEAYPFLDLKERDLFAKITHELRCSVCQNQSIADSAAPIAVDLRNEIYRKIQSQESEQQIIEFVTSRYGSFVLYEPPLNWGTGLLWIGPFVLLGVALWMVLRTFKIK